MKKYVIFASLFFCVSFTLSAQSRKDASIYVPPVTGTGSNPEDASFFYKQLVFELTYQNYNMAKAEKNADFILAGTITPYNKRESADADQYVFRLELHDGKTGDIIADGELLYETPTDLINSLPILIYTLIFTIPEDADKRDEWRDKLLYFGGSGFWTPRVYAENTASTHFVNFGGGISAECHFLDFISVEAGVRLASDWISVSANTVNNYYNLLIEIPVLIKYVIKPGEYFMLEPYAGAHINIPLYPVTNPPLFSWLIGFQYGVKAGPGVLFIDPRFAMDIGKSVVEETPGIIAPPFQRYIIYIGIGYKYGILKR